MRQEKRGRYTAKGKIIPVNKDKIDLKSPSNLKYWVEELKCTPDQLRLAIYKVGCSVKEIKKYVESLKHN